MATADELLTRSVSGDDKTLVIDNDLRTISIPKSITNLGVEYDDDVLHLNFRMPRYLGTVDLSAFSIRINYLNSKGESDVFTVSKPTVSTDSIEFVWLVGPTATRYKGSTKFNVCLRIVNSNNIVEKEYNTTIATLPVLEGLEVDEGVVTEYSDVLEQWRRELFGIGDTEEAAMRAVSQEEQRNIVKKGIEVLATIPEEYQDTVDTAQEGIRTKADAIVCSISGTSITVSDSSDDYIRGLRILGKTTQAVEPTPNDPQDLVSIDNTTVDVCGGNLFNFKGITPTSNISVNADGTITVTIYAAPTGQTLKQLAPSLKVGSRYMLTLDTDGPNKFIYLIGVKSTWDKGAVLTMTEEILNSLVYVYGVNGDYPTVIRNIAIVPEGVAYNDAPYIDPQTLTLDRTLPGVPVTSEGNYTDENGQQWVCDEVDFERGVYIERVQTVVLNGSENISREERTGGTYRFVIRQFGPIRSKPAIGGLCTHFKYDVAPVGENNLDNVMCLWTTGYPYCRFDGIETVEDMIDWLSGQYEAGTPVTIKAVRETPVETPLTDEELLAFKALHTNYPSTTVVNDSGALMVLAYNADTRTYIDNKIKERVPGELTDDQIAEALAAYLAQHPVTGSTARIASVSLPSANWLGSTSPYYQVVQIAGVTENTQVDLTPSIEQLAVFHDKDLAFVTENEDGVVTVYALGDKPANDYEIQVTMTEVYV